MMYLHTIISLGNPGSDQRTHLASKSRFARAFGFFAVKCVHAVRSPFNPVPSWHYRHGRAGWREGS